MDWIWILRKSVKGKVKKIQIFYFLFGMNHHALAAYEHTCIECPYNCVKESITYKHCNVHCKWLPYAQPHLVLSSQNTQTNINSGVVQGVVQGVQVPCVNICPPRPLTPSRAGWRAGREWSAAWWRPSQPPWSVPVSLVVPDRCVIVVMIEVVRWHQLMSVNHSNQTCVYYLMFLFQLVDGALILYWLLWAPHDSDSSLYITGVATALVCLGEDCFKLKLRPSSFEILLIFYLEKYPF